MTDNLNIKLSEEDKNIVLAAYREFSNYSKAAEPVILQLIEQEISKIGLESTVNKGLVEVTKEVLRQYPDKYDLEKLIQPQVGAEQVAEKKETTHVLVPFGSEGSTVASQENEPFPINELYKFIAKHAGKIGEGEFLYNLVRSIESNPAEYVAEKKDGIDYLDPNKLLPLIKDARFNYNVARETGIELPGTIEDLTAKENLQGAAVDTYKEHGYEPNAERVKAIVDKLKDFGATRISKTLISDIVLKAIENEIKDKKEEKRKEQDAVLEELEKIPGGTTSGESKEPLVKIIEYSSKPQSSIPTTSLESSEIKEPKNSKSYGGLIITTLATAILALYLSASSLFLNKKDTNRLEKNIAQVQQLVGDTKGELTKYTPKETQQKINDSHSVSIGTIERQLRELDNFVKEGIRKLEQDSDKKLEDRIMAYEDSSKKEISEVKDQINSIQSSAVNQSHIETLKSEYDKKLSEFQTNIETLSKSVQGFITDEQKYEIQKAELEKIRIEFSDLSNKIVELYKKLEGKPKLVEEKPIMHSESKKIPKRVPKPEIPEDVKKILEK